jgi:ATP synthase protein I
MTDGTRKNGEDKRLADEEAALSARLQRLGERLGQDQAGGAVETGPSRASRASALARGFRLSSEFVGGVILGAAIGWLLDRWLGITPWGLIVFLLLGFAAGVLNVIRAAGSDGVPSGEADRQ